MKSTARAHWEGDLQDGGGRVTIASGVAGPMPVDWKARTEGKESFTTPEELLAAAHSACFSMALSNILSKQGHRPESLDTSATATFEKVNGARRITTMKLEVRGNVPGVSAADFAEAAEKAKEDCPVSQALSDDVAVSVEAELV